MSITERPWNTVRAISPTPKAQGWAEADQLTVRILLIANYGTCVEALWLLCAVWLQYLVRAIISIERIWQSGYPRAFHAAPTIIEEDFLMTCANSVYANLVADRDSGTLLLRR